MFSLLQTVYTCSGEVHVLASYPAFPDFYRLRYEKPIFHTASNENLGVGKAGYEAMVCKDMTECHSISNARGGRFPMSMAKLQRAHR